MPKKIDRPIQQVTVYLFQDQLRPLAVYAAQHGRAVSEIIRDLVDRFLAEEENNDENDFDGRS